MPSPQHLVSAEPYLVMAYTHYGAVYPSSGIDNDVGPRFASLPARCSPNRGGSSSRR